MRRPPRPVRSRVLNRPFVRPSCVEPRRPGWTRVFACLLLVGGLAGCAQPAGPARPWIGQAFSTQAVSVSHPLAARAAMDMLDAGGSAVDAAIAAQMVMTLVEPQSSGIGGGGFLIHYDSKLKKIETYDGRETAPASAVPGLFLDQRGGPLPYRQAILGGRAVGVPGLLRMLEMAHRDHGRLPWARLFGPAIRLSENGFPISARLARQIAGDGLIHRVPAAKAYFHGPDGPKPAGTILKNPALAETLSAIAARGAEAFYSGDIAQAIARAVSRAPHHPAKMTLADLAGYRAVKRPPVCSSFRYQKICGMGPPSSGGIATLQILGLLEHFPLTASGPNSARAVHLIAEAGRLAFADRKAYLGDGDFIPIPVQGLIDRDYLADRARLISPDRANEGVVEPGRPPGAKGAAYDGPSDETKGLSTAHMSIVDRFGNALSYTSTIESAFGSRLFVRGFLLNNELTDFSFRPDWRGRPAPNRVAAGKRPRSSMSPTLVLGPDGGFRFATGSPGGSRIIGYTVRSLLGVLAWGLDPQSAADLPHAMNRGGATEVEEGLIGVVDALRAKGHRVAVSGMRSGLQSIERTAEGLRGAADRRREGVVLGK